MAFAKTGLFVGLNHGFIVTKPKTHHDSHKIAKSHRKGRLHPRVAAVRQVIQEISGLAPYERKMLEMIRTGVQKKEKLAVKLARKRLGSQRRANAKRDQMVAVIAAQRKRAWVFKFHTNSNEDNCWVKTSIRPFAKILSVVR